ncbi:MAG: hypothetical protein ACK4TP_12805 [Hyphomicrobium sp.]
MFKFHRNNPVIRERDADGVLTAAGFEWREFQSWIFEIFGTASIGLFFFGSLCASDRKAYSNPAPMIFLLMVACVLVCVYFGHIRRGIAFHRDGSVSIRGDWSNRLELWGEIKEYAHISSIEPMKTKEGMGVAILSNYGGTVMLSHDLTEPAARLAAVQLTIALREMRESLASIANFQMPQQAAAAAAASWID